MHCEVCVVLYYHTLLHSEQHKQVHTNKNTDHPESRPIKLALFSTIPRHQQSQPVHHSDSPLFASCSTVLCRLLRERWQWRSASLGLKHALVRDDEVDPSTEEPCSSSKNTSQVSSVIQIHAYFGSVHHRLHYQTGETVGGAAKEWLRRWVVGRTLPRPSPVMAVVVGWQVYVQLIIITARETYSNKDL